MTSSLIAFLVAQKDAIAAAADIVTILGVPVAIFVYLREKHKERRRREYETYDALDERFIEFQRMCLEHPTLDIHDIQSRDARELTGLEQKQELVAYTILFSIFERAYLMYYDQTTDVKARQWTGWEDYIRNYLARERARSAWQSLNSVGGSFDSKFVNYMNLLLQNAVPNSSSSGRAEARR